MGREEYCRRLEMRQSHGRGSIVTQRRDNSPDDRTREHLTEEVSLQDYGGALQMEGRGKGIPERSNSPERWRKTAVLNTSKSVCLEPGNSFEEEVGEEGKDQCMTEGFFSHLSTLYFILMTMRSCMRWSNLFDLETNWIWREGSDESSKWDAMRA